MTLMQFVLASMMYLAPKQDHTVMSNAIHDVISSESPLFSNDESKTRTASLIIAIAYREGSLKPSIIGDCDNSKPGICKGKPHSFCTMQINDSMGGSEWLNENPYLCIQTGLRLLRTSFHSCILHPIAWYASGPNGCTNERARRISNDRMNLAHWIWLQNKDK